MAYCTVLEWDETFPFDRYDELNDRAGDHKQLPDGCLARVVGPVQAGPRSSRSGNRTRTPSVSAIRTRR
jgi:hypothetical protein